MLPGAVDPLQWNGLCRLQSEFVNVSDVNRNKENAPPPLESNLSAVHLS